MVNFHQIKQMTCYNGEFPPNKANDVFFIELFLGEFPLKMICEKLKISRNQKIRRKKGTF